MQLLGAERLLCYRMHACVSGRGACGLVYLGSPYPTRRLLAWAWPGVGEG